MICSVEAQFLRLNLLSLASLARLPEEQPLRRECIPRIQAGPTATHQTQTKCLQILRLPLSHPSHSTGPRNEHALPSFFVRFPTSRPIPILDLLPQTSLRHPVAASTSNAIVYSRRTDCDTYPLPAYQSEFPPPALTTSRLRTHSG